ncbi:MAG TPA: hypothetical protein VGU45_12310 [Microvirga sp.]|jgi:hypothetical protein|nr:hypothetical protein [Microvirga sp.]
MDGTPSCFDYVQALADEAAALEKAAVDLFLVAEVLSRRGRHDEATEVKAAGYARRVAGIERNAQSFALSVKAATTDLDQG